MDSYAHSTPGPQSQWETMAEHEAATARFCREFLHRIHPELEPWGDLLGRWHDLGKYQPDFQAKLAGQSIHVEHAGIGAALAACAGTIAAEAIAFAIAGHHAGLANRSTTGSRKSLRVRVEENLTKLERLRHLLPKELLELPVPLLPSWLNTATSDKLAWRRSFCFFTRMLFSALVDSDRLATDAFYARAEGRPTVSEQLEYEALHRLRERLDAHIDRLAQSKGGAMITPVNQLRAEVLAACRDKALLPPGLFSLTVPTGGGKTLSAMSFALRHAVEHQLDRVIVVIPFTSIIEQNAMRYRDALGSNGQPDERNVLEHHSGIDEQKNEEHNQEAELKRRLAAENWDAPIVVTTAVQFFESLFSDHPSRCRKLHRIAKSVVILDEVQTLPPGLLLPILDALRELTNHYGTSIVLSTATPPALTGNGRLSRDLMRPIIEDPTKLARQPAAQRVQIEWRTNHVTSYAQLAEELVEHRQVLAIVHRRADARVLAELLPEQGRFHLSALMCPAHRLAQIEQIQAALAADETCRIISTQLIEAGVDIDLPIVYRALAGIDSLAQSAGRCDREGLRTQKAGKPAGRFVVFRAETEPPPGTLRAAMHVTDQLLGLQADLATGEPLDPFNPEHCERFFTELYGNVPLDAKHVQREQSDLNFEKIAEAFQMIENGWARPLVVPWGEGLARAEAYRNKPSRLTGRALQLYTVQVARPYFDYLRSLGVIELWEDRLGLPTSLFTSKFYCEQFGLLVDPEAQLSADVLVM